MEKFGGLVFPFASYDDPNSRSTEEILRATSEGIVGLRIRHKLNSDQRCASSPISRASLVLFGPKPEKHATLPAYKVNLSVPSPLFIMDLVNQRPNFADIYPNIAAVLQNDPRLPEETNASWSPCHEDRTSF